MSNLILDPFTDLPSSTHLQFLCNQIIDDSTANLYIGYAIINGGPDDPIWRILRVRTNSSTGFKESFWAYDATSSIINNYGFNKIFTNRASYSY